MKKRRVVECVMGVVFGLCLLVPARAAIHFQNLGTGAPPSTVGGIHVTPFNVAPQAAISDLTSVTSVPGAPVPANMTLSTALSKRTVPGSWATWSHGYRGPVYFTDYASSVTLTLPPKVNAFYLYIEPDAGGFYAITATTDSGATSGPVSVTGSGGATGFGFYTDGSDAIATITITAPAAAGGFAIGEFGMAAPNWAVITNDRDDTISTVDLSTCTPTVHGPFLSGSLGSGDLVDAAVTPDGHYALVSNFQGEKIYRIDLTDPTAPILAGSVSVPFMPEDIAIAPNGAFALVTDGGNSKKIAAIDLSSFSLESTYRLTTPGAHAIAVAIASDDQTVVVVDNDNNQILYGTYDPGSGFASENTLSTGYSPFNASISPDGRTVLVANESGSSVSLYKITSPGVLSATGTVTGLPPDPSSLAFSPGGSRAYVFSVAFPNAMLSTLDITGPGTATLAPGPVSLLPGYGSAYFGVDQLAVSPDGRTILAGDPAGDHSEGFSTVRTSDYAASTISTHANTPTGIATFMSTVGSVYPNIAVSPSSLSATPADWPYSRTFTVSGGTGPWTFVQSGTLPTGLTFVDNGDGTATLSGTPTQPGDFSFTITAQDADGCWGSRTYTMTVSCPAIDVLPAVLPDPTMGQSYSQSLTASAGVGPFTFEVTGGSLPQGLTLSAGGLLSGTPTATGSSTFTVMVTDADGCTGTRTYSAYAFSFDFTDDAGAAQVCVDADTGFFQWSVLTGPYAGMTYTGTLNVYNGGTMFWSQPGASQYVYIYYDPNGHSAWGYVYDYTTYAYTSLSDSNTLNNPPCGATAF